MISLPKDRVNSAFSGELRKVGYELEFAGLDLDSAATAVAESLSGKIHPITKAECKVESDKLGTFKIELDWTQGKDLAEERHASLKEETGEDNPDDPIMDFFTDTAATVVPMEIVCPPIRVEHLDALTPMVKALREAGATGTKASTVYAFGVHINPELPDDKAETIAAYLKAYSIAQDWLLIKHDVDLSRRITPYVNLYPKKYIRTVLEYTNEVKLEQLISDYIEYNPTRNRALDMTPLFKYIDKDRVEREFSDERINSRPTFHYRLPNCNIEQKGWSLMDSWSLWCVIEELASDVSTLDTLADDWLSYDRKWINFKKPSWHKKLEKIHQNLLSE